MGEISEEQMEDIKEAFEVFTRTANQEISYDQVADILRVLKFNPCNEDVVKLLGSPTKEEMSTKLLKFDEFVPLYSKALTEIVPGTYDDLLEGFRIFDREGNGTVMGAELRHVLRTLGEKMTIPDINAVMDGREDMNGVINIEVELHVEMRKELKSAEGLKSEFVVPNKPKIANFEQIDE